MARYYFDLKDGTRLRDHDGINFNTDAEAISHAEVIAKEIARDRPVFDPDAPQLFVSIIHGNGHEVDKVPVQRGLTGKSSA